MRSISAAESPRIMRRPNPHMSLKPGWAPMATPFAFARSAVRNMMLGSPACQPQATLAEVTILSMASSSPIFQGPNPSPMSLLRSMFISLLAVIPGRSGRAAEGKGIHDLGLAADNLEANRPDAHRPTEFVTPDC